MQSIFTAQKWLFFNSLQSSEETPDLFIHYFHLFHLFFKVFIFYVQWLSLQWFCIYLFWLWVPFFGFFTWKKCLSENMNTLTVEIDIYYYFAFFILLSLKACFFLCLLAKVTRWSVTFYQVQVDLGVGTTFWWLSICTMLLLQLPDLIDAEPWCWAIIHLWIH